MYKTRKVIAFLIALIMIISCVPVSLTEDGKEQITDTVQNKDIVLIPKNEAPETPDVPEYTEELSCTLPGAQDVALSEAIAELAITTDQSHRKGSGVPLTNATFIPAPYMYPELDTIAYMRDLLEDDHSGAEKPAALFVETLQAEGGINVMSSEWLRAAYDLCREYGLLFVVDDIQVGCCRTGEFFSFERAGIQPDIVTMSKSIGGYGFPLALVLIKPEYDIWAPAEHNGTFRGNQLAFVAANAGLEYMLDNKIEEHVREMETVAHDFIAREILPLDSRLAARGRGLIWGIDCSKIPAEGFSGRVLDRCFGKDLIIESCGRKGSVVKIMPPLVIEKDILLKGLEIVRDSIAEELKTL